MEAVQRSHLRTSRFFPFTVTSMLAECGPHTGSPWLVTRRGTLIVSCVAVALTISISPPVADVYCNEQLSGGSLVNLTRFCSLTVLKPVPVIVSSSPQNTPLGILVTVTSPPPGGGGGLFGFCEGSSESSEQDTIIITATVAVRKRKLMREFIANFFSKQVTGALRGGDTVFVTVLRGIVTSFCFSTHGNRFQV